MNTKFLKSLVLGLALPLATGACAAGSVPGGGVNGIVSELAPPAPHVSHAVLAGAPSVTGMASPAAFAAIGALTIDVTVDDKGFHPQAVSVPAGAKVRLVLRNRGLQEHHFHIAGLNPTEMLWLVKDFDSGAPLISTGPDDHAAHHGVAMAAHHICTARGGICPTGADVHAHAGPGDVDVIMFTTNEKGTFQVTCPLHPGMQGKIAVF